MLPVASITLTAIAIAAFALIWAVRQSDEVSVERQLRTTERSIQAIVGELAKQQEMVAVWDDAVLQLNKPTLDLQWLDANLGIWLSRTFDQDQVYILNAQNEPIDATIDEARVSPGEFNRVRPGLESLLQGLRGDRSSPHADHVDRPDDPIYLTTGKAVHDAHLLELQGRPAAVSAMKIVPESTDVPQAPGSEFLLVSIRFLDGSFIDEIARRNLIESLRFSREDIPHSGEVSVPLKSDAGRLIGYFIWRPELPGSKILQVVGPSAAVACLIMVVLTVRLVRSLRRSMSKLQRAVVELRASEAQAHYLAFHDVLTGLPNRAMLDEKLDQALIRTRRGKKTAVLMLDLDRFKNINDTLGHQAGDDVVKELAGRLSDVLPSTDFLARLGGDEFAIVQAEIDGNDDAEALCTRILETVRQPFQVLGHQIFVGVSIGVAIAPDAGLERVDLMRKADIALYRAKAEGRDACRIFTAEMDETVKLRSIVEDELRAAIANGDELRVFYQPQVDMSGPTVIGLEALVRWQHPAHGLIEPSRFIAVAEETGLINQLGEWVLQQACLASKRWPDLSIAVNLSPVQFRTSGFAERLIEIVRDNGVDPRRIEIEITESLLLNDDELSHTALRILRKAGFKIALDDFGTGYSSLSYLRRFEVDKVKIDQSFVQHLEGENETAAIVSSIVSLCQAMGLTVIAEGVETEDQRRFLSTAGCSEMQGFLFSRALPEEQVSSLLANLRETGGRAFNMRPSPA
ncbi:putative bifunctional diguanylate cyclase/phosphodiesterase [Microvirga roseola]|uniref:putative bifunctional diguanylate cyclase/phosphodiesterase n=1 Tax=Microvirga roseola TaxID=2883126 RepID=UPI001E615339|nr:EAL domain-containing protein [Microvirga roseola]